MGKKTWKVVDRADVVPFHDFGNSGSCCFDQYTSDEQHTHLRSVATKLLGGHKDRNENQQATQQGPQN